MTRLSLTVTDYVSRHQKPGQIYLSNGDLDRQPQKDPGQHCRWTGNRHEEATGLQETESKRNSMQYRRAFLSALPLSSTRLLFRDFG